MTFELSQDYSSLAKEPVFIKQVAFEKLSYMRDFAKSSTIATILAPLLCVPLYDSNIGGWQVYAWYLLMAVVVTIRIFLVKSIHLDKGIDLNFKKLNWSWTCHICVGHGVVAVSSRHDGSELFAVSNYFSLRVVCWHGGLLR